MNEDGGICYNYNTFNLLQNTNAMCLWSLSCSSTKQSYYLQHNITCKSEYIMFYYHVKFAHLKVCIAVNVYVNIFVSLVCATLLVLIYDYMVSKLMHKHF